MIQKIWVPEIWTLDMILKKYKSWKFKSSVLNLDHVSNVRMRMNAKFCCGHKNPMFSAVISRYQFFFSLHLISSHPRVWEFLILWVDRKLSQNIRRILFLKTIRICLFFLNFWLESKKFRFLNIRNFLKVFFFSFFFFWARKVTEIQEGF